MSRAPRSAGFTLLEVLIAIAIFAFVAGAAMATMSSSDELAIRAKRARELRMLAERLAGEILAFEQHYDDPNTGDFHGWSEYGERFKDWTWDLEVRGSPGPPLYVFGVGSQDDAQYLFGAPTEEEKTQSAQPASGAAAGGQPGQTQSRGKAQEIRELVLTVKAPQEGSSETDSVQLVIFAPVVEKQGAKPGTAK
jgi:prepilin-type N-terminal cleavage/methylation domain-containing protein